MCKLWKVDIFVSQIFHTRAVKLDGTEAEKPEEKKSLREKSTETV